MAILVERKAEILYAEDTKPDEIADRVLHGQIGLMDWGDPKNMIFVMIGNAGIPDVLNRMNRIKGRPQNQVLAVSGSAELVMKLGNVSASQAIQRVCKSEDVSAGKLVARLFEYPIGLVVEANPDLPNGITKINGRGQNTVMIAGQSYNPKYGYYDLYNPSVRAMDKKGIIPCASSGNRENEQVYTVYQQEKAYKDFRGEIDFFIKRSNLDPDYRNRRITSCTAIDLSGGEPIAKRWGSRDISYFEQYLGKIRLLEETEVLSGAEVLEKSLSDPSIPLNFRTRLLLALNL